jgi:hypothetical protein
MASEASRAPGRIPQTIECELTNDLVNSAIPGDVVVVSGIVKLMVDENSRERKLDKHCKKRGVLPNPQKRFRRFLKASKEAQSLKKQIKKSTKPLKVLPVYPGEGPSPTKPLGSVQEKKVYKKPLEFHITSYELLGFSTKPLGCNMEL